MSGWSVRVGWSRPCWRRSRLVELGQAPPVLDGSRSASSIRRRSLTAQAAPISLVGSQMVEHLAEPFPLLGTEVFGTGQEQPPVDPDRVGDGARRPSRSRVTRCRTSVSIWFARATRCHLSTAISAFGSAARIPEAYGADGSITTISIAARNAGVCSASHSLTQLPVRPGANPSSDPGPSAEQSTKLVSHGSDRFQVMPSRIQRTDRKRVSSMPSGSLVLAQAATVPPPPRLAAPSARTRGTRRRPQRPLDSPKRSLEQPAPAAAQITRGAAAAET